MFYRKYRPKTFEEVIGQSLIIKILKNIIKSSKVPHGYLFAGEHGTGKTTVARIFAKALNCHQNKEGEPCLNCYSCKLFEENKMLDLVELDAASNRGIDEIRNLKEHIGFQPIQGRYKVFIIDEAHMLTEPAFNALLKTLEEPPKHAIFILATTEPEKIPSTIHSRVQRFDFRRISPKLIVQKLKFIAEKEKIPVTEGALWMIAEESQGSLRDAEVLFEKLSFALNPHGVLTQEVVEEMLGKASINHILQFLDLIGQKKSKEAIQFLHNIYDAGYDLILFVKSTLKILREMILLLTLEEYEKHLKYIYPEEAFKKIKEIAQRLSIKNIQKLTKKFFDAEAMMKKDPPIMLLPLEFILLEYFSEEN
jgi:DNA polymerase-3 subunit gamma/tau